MREEPTGPGERHTTPARQQASERRPRNVVPMAFGAFVRLRWRKWAMWLLLLVGLAGELVLMALVYQLVDLTLSLMEVWAELARKHLELTLTTVFSSSELTTRAS